MKLNFISKLQAYLLLLLLLTTWNYSGCTHGIFLNWRFLEDAINQLSQFTSRSSRNTRYASIKSGGGGIVGFSSNTYMNAILNPNTSGGGGGGSGSGGIDASGVASITSGTGSGQNNGHQEGGGGGDDESSDENPYPVVHNQHQSTSSSNQIKCYDELGCIEINDEWFDILHRPLNLLPLDRQTIHTRFILYTRKRVTDPVEVLLNRTNLLESGFQPQLGVKFVIHGFIDTGFSSWVVKLSQQLTTHSDVNVFAVDWGGGSLSFYTQATANTRVVGLELAHFVKFLMNEFNTQPKDIHLIGHSLGAHVAGYAGQKIEGLGRITGLDPAEPYFQNMPTFVRLDPTDARFVDIIHTDGRTILLGGYGMIQPCGHMDFYPNNGKEQPGCDLAKNPMNLINAHGLDQVQREIFACNHHRAIYYFIESLLTTCPYIAHRCPDYDTYLMGQCHSCGPNGTLCAKMGIDSYKYPIGNRSNVRFYLSTAKAPPYCVYHYRINLQMAYPRQAEPWVTGKVRMNIRGSEMSINNINLTPTDNLRVQHGTNITFMIQNNKPIGTVEDVQIEWKYNSNYLDVMAQCWRFMCNSKLFVKRVDITDMDMVLEEEAEDEEGGGVDDPSSAESNNQGLFRGNADPNSTATATPSSTNAFTLNSSTSSSSSSAPEIKPSTVFETSKSKDDQLTYSLCGEEGTKYTGITSGGSVTFGRLC